MTPHNEAKITDIANIVIMPGDPNRVKYIVKKFIKDAKIVNSVRSNYAYTGYYKDKKVTIMSSGMGMPSMAIYAYELFEIYKVDQIIRIGSCGAYDKKIKLGSIILSEEAYTSSNFAYQYDGKKNKKCQSSKELNEKIIKTNNNNNFYIGMINTSDMFYHDYKDKKIPKKCLAVEMESFALFYMAQKLNKKATSVLTVSDNLVTKEEMSSLEREKTFDEAIILVLESL